MFDLQARNLGSKADAALSLYDANGVLLASNNGFDGGDPLLVFKMPAPGRYRIRVNDNMAGGSHEHFYRLSLGALPEVVGCYPLECSPPIPAVADVRLIGYNLPPGSKAHVKAGKDGEVDVPVDPEKFRARRTFKVVTGILPVFQEVIATNAINSPAQAMKISAPCHHRSMAASGTRRRPRFRPDDCSVSRPRRANAGPSKPTPRAAVRRWIRRLKSCTRTVRRFCA